MFVPKERGKAQSLYGLGPLLGPVCGTIAGGWIAQELRSWRWLLWVLTIVSSSLYQSWTANGFEINTSCTHHSSLALLHSSSLCCYEKHSVRFCYEKSASDLPRSKLKLHHLHPIAQLEQQQQRTVLRITQRHAPLSFHPPQRCCNVLCEWSRPVRP